MMRCPICGHSSHTRTSRYLTSTTKEAYYQCQGILCSCTFKTVETVIRLISEPSGITVEDIASSPIKKEAAPDKI